MSWFKGKPPGKGTFEDRIRKAGEHRPAPAAEPDNARAQQKREERRPVFADATLHHSGGKMPAVVTNLSSLGARVEFTSNVTLQGNVALVAPTLGLNTPVRVAWQKGRSAGLIFVKPKEGT